MTKIINSDIMRYTPEIAPHILRYWKARQTDRKIVENLQNHFDTSRYGLGYTKFREIRNDMGLLHTRQQSHTIESIHEAMIELRKAYPNAARHLKRRRFWAAGVNDLFAVDQHNKWLRFSLALHTGVEPFSGRIMWIRVWHSNRNPQLILTYYLETIQKLGHIPLVTQSDPGTENYGIANAHTMLHQMNDPALQVSVTAQVYSWFQNILDEGVEDGWYDSDNTLQVMIFRWIFIPWLQCELDRYQDRVNNTLKRPDRNKVLPHGVPNLIYKSPEAFGALDFKVTVKQDDIDYVRRLYVDPDHPVFDLVPRPLNDFIQGCYEDLGRPPITRQAFASPRKPKRPFFHEDTDGTYYMGGIHGGQGLDASDHHRLDELAELDEPGAHLLPTAPIIEEEALVIAEFSDEEDNDETFDCTVKAAEARKSTRHRHAHMHTREEVGIVVETVQDLEVSLAWAPLLSTEPGDADDLLAGPESISPDDVAAEFSSLEELKRTEDV
ncbi:hypothetical protein EDB19DRAFT_1902323 [Suillus lakei]|nr:hypothetical protein EDB19DRAFT_1902323 [Suillus lakei]